MSKFKLTLYHHKIIEAFGEFSHHTLGTLAPLVARGRTAPAHSWVQRKVRELVDEEYLGVYRPGFGVPHIFFPRKIALDQLTLDQREKASLLNKASHTNPRSHSIQEHELPLAYLYACIASLHRQNQIRFKMYYAKHRQFPVRGQFYSSRHKAKLWKNANTDGFYIWENKPFDSNVMRNLFVESDTGHTNLSRTKLEEGSSLERHLQVYESLLQEPNRLAPLRIAKFGVLILRPDLREGGDQLNPDVFVDTRVDNIVELLARKDFALLRRHVYFTHTGLLQPGTHLRVQNWERKWVYLTK